MSVSKLVNLIGCRTQTAKTSANVVVAERHYDEMRELTKEFMPSGSGFDSGTSIVLDESTRNKLVFSTGFHHMNNNGMYCGWTEHKVIVTPTFGSFDIKVTGKNKNDIKEYIAEAFQAALCQDISHVWDNDTLTFVFERVR